MLGAGGKYFGSLSFFSFPEIGAGAMSRRGGDTSWWRAGLSVFLRTALELAALFLLASTAEAATGRSTASATMNATATTDVQEVSG